MRTSTVAGCAVAAFALLACASEPNSAPQSEAAPIEQQSIRIAVFRGGIAAGCDQVLLQMTPKFQTAAPFLDATKIKDFTCQCVTERIMSDSRIQKLLKQTESEFESARISANFKQYVSARIMGTLMSCLGMQINKQTNDASLDF